MTVVIVIRPHLQEIRIKELGDRRDRHHDCSDRHHTPPAGISYKRTRATFVIAVIIIEIVISTPPATCGHFLMKEMTINVIAIIAADIVVIVNKG